MPNNQDLIDAHISGKIDARDNKAPDPDIEPGYSDNVFYLRGYHEEKKRMESAEYCRIRGLPITVYGYFATAGGSCVPCHRD